MRPGCPVSSSDSWADDVDSTLALLDQPSHPRKWGIQLPELSGETWVSAETWVAATYLDALTADLPATDSDLDFIVASQRDETLTTVHQ